MEGAMKAYRSEVSSKNEHEETTKLRTSSTSVKDLLSELQHTKDSLKLKDKELEKLKAEMHKLQSILDTKVHKVGKRAPTFQEKNKARGKRPGISGDSSLQLLKLAKNLEHHDKDYKSRQLIRDALQENMLLKNLTSLQMREIALCTFPKNVKKDEFVIKEGEIGQYLYVSVDGTFEVTNGTSLLGVVGPGEVFGELAVLYNCIRTASVRAVEPSQMWVLDRKIFQAIMVKTGNDFLNEKLHFLNSVPLLKDLNSHLLVKIADALEVDYFHDGEYIIRERAIGNTFFIISKGQVRVTQTVEGRTIDREVRVLHRGDYFGERALLSEDRRTANVIAMAPGVECLTLDRTDFVEYISSLSRLVDKNYEEDKTELSTVASTIFSSKKDLETITSATFEAKTMPQSPISAKSIDLFIEKVHLKDLHIVATLGIGAFGRVELVQLLNDKTKTFALKCIKKKHIVDTNQQEHVFSEKRIMMSLHCPFIPRMYKSFKDKKFVYMLMEVCLGGELWSILRDRGHFDDTMARFCTACVLEAFQYLHKMDIVFRDLKPENLMMSSTGYIKLVDFGFAKYLGDCKKTWTFCGTPEYVAPEIILNKGHDLAADYWSLGILIFELLNGIPPFTDNDPMKMYNHIVKGIDTIEFPKHIGRTPTALIKKLCRQNPVERLGYGKGGITDIKTHKWFQGFDWEGLENHKLVPPMIPVVKGPADFSNYDMYEKEANVPPDETSGWDANF